MLPIDLFCFVFCLVWFGFRFFYVIIFHTKNISTCLFLLFLSGLFFVPISTSLSSFIRCSLLLFSYLYYLQCVFNFTFQLKLLRTHNETQKQTKLGSCKIGYHRFECRINGARIGIQNVFIGAIFGFFEFLSLHNRFDNVQRNN